jgi:D-xylonolactonase
MAESAHARTRGGRTESFLTHGNSGMNIELVCQYHNICGESPTWHGGEGRLYWVDNEDGKMFSFEPATGEHGLRFAERTVAAMTVQADGSMLLFMDKGSIGIWREGRLDGYVVEEIPGERGSRFNDVVADPQGRVYGGTMAGEGTPGRLYCIERDGSYRVMLEGVAVPNGMGFTLDEKRMYFTDSMARTIWLFDYERGSGDLTNQRVFVRLEETDGLPDGLTVDGQGNVWSAVWGGGRVDCHSAEGKRLEQLAVPTANVSCAVFGGVAMDELYITTATIEDPSANEATAGALYRARVGVRGRNEYPSRIKM